MKKMTFAAACLLTASVMNAQSIYDAARIMEKDLNGTARFVGMGGALGALGGDISTIGTNPAGIGIFRSNDVMTSFSVYANSQSGKYLGKDNRLFSYNQHYNRMSYDNAGFVLSMKRSNVAPLRFINLSFNYHKAKNFYKNTRMSGALNDGPQNEQISQLWQIADMTNGLPSSALLEDRNAFTDPDLGWLSVLGWNGLLIQDAGKDKNGNMLYRPAIPEEYGAFSEFRSEERGGVDQYDLNASFNFNDRVYLGATLGLYNVSYTKRTLYDESYLNDNSGQGYELQTFNNIHGAGVDFKMGIIVRPFEYSPFRIGFAVHTPTIYNLDYVTSAQLVSDMYQNGGNELKHTQIDTFNEVGDMVRSFQLRSPWVYNVSLGYTLESYLAVGAEYEFKDYGKTHFRYPEGDLMDFETTEAQLCMEGVHTLRLGVEINALPRFAIRGGFNYDTATFKEDAFKNLPLNSISTDTDYANTKERITYSLGVGYRGRVFYADVTYKNHMYKEDFYAFHDSANLLNATKMKNTQNQVLFTVGARF